MSCRLLLITTLAFALLASAARAGTYEHRTLPGSDGWSPAVSAPGGYASTGVEAGGVWAGFFGRSVFDPGDLAEWSYAAPGGTSVVSWVVERTLFGLGDGDWNALFYAVEDDRWRLLARDVPAADRPWGRIGSAGLGASRLVARLVCAGPRPCRRAASEATLRLRGARALLHDPSAPSVGAVQGDLARREVLRGVERLSFAAADRGGGLYRTVVEVDGRDAASAVVDANGGRCRDLAPAEAGLQVAHRVPCALAASATVALDTRRLADGPHTIAVHVLDAAGNRATVYGPHTKTVANAPAPSPPAVQAPPAAGPEAPPAAPSAGRTVVRAWLEHGSTRGRTATASFGRRVRIRGRAMTAAGRPLPGASLRVTEQLVDGYGRPLPGRVPVAARAAAKPFALGVPSVAATATATATSTTTSTAAARPRWPAVTGVRTRRNGRFTLFTRVGPSRRITIAALDGATAPRLTLHVRAPVRLRASSSGAIEGRVHGGHVPRGSLVDLQVRARGRWATRFLLRTGAHGRFSARAGALPRGGLVRARVPRRPRLPYATGTSRPALVR